MQTFQDYQTDVGNLLERSDSGMRTKIKTFLNDGQRFIIGYRPWMALLRNTSFSAVANLDYLITGPEVAQVIHISQRETPVVLALAKYYALLQRNIDALSTTGNPSVATPAGDVGVKAALPSAGTITVESSSASDITQVIRVNGYDSTTLLAITESLTLNGTTAATSSNSYSAAEGYEPKFSKDETTVGYVTIKRSSTTIAQIAPAATESRYKKWKVWPAFSSNLTMYLTSKARVYDMVNAEDTPPFDMDNAIKMFAFARCLQEKRQIAKAKEIYGVVDANGQYNPGSFMAELETLVAAEPQFGENFTDQFLPQVNRDGIDMQGGSGGYMLWPAS